MTRETTATAETLDRPPADPCAAGWAAVRERARRLRRLADELEAVADGWDAFVRIEGRSGE